MKVPGGKTKLRQSINFGIKNFRKNSIQSIEEEDENISMDDEKFLESILGETNKEDEEYIFIFSLLIN